SCPWPEKRDRRRKAARRHPSSRPRSSSCLQYRSTFAWRRKETARAGQEPARTPAISLVPDRAGLYQMLSSVLADLSLCRPPVAWPVGQAANAREDVAGQAGGRVLLRVDFERRLTAVAEDRVAALKVLDEALDGLRIKLDLLWALRNGDRLPPA